MSNQIKFCNFQYYLEVLKIVKSCSKWLSDKGMNHWKDYYTNEIILQKIYNTRILGFFENNAINGVVSLSIKPPVYYNIKEDFRDSNNSDEKSVYVSMLAVNPEYHNRGIASKLMTFVEDLAKGDDIYSIRLDAFASYSKLNKFYKERGYDLIKAGDDDGDLMNFYEKILLKS